MIEAVVSIAVGFAFVEALANSLKKLGIDTKWIPLVNFITGIVFGLLLVWYFGLAIEEGIIYGLAISGTSTIGYDAGKKLFSTEKKK